MKQLRKIVFVFLLLVLLFCGCDDNTTSVKNRDSTSNEKRNYIVYITPTGKRYHRDSDCGGKNSYPTTLDYAIQRELTPCKKCTQ